MFHHFDVVTLRRTLPGVDMPVGTEGTVIRIFDWMNPVIYDVIVHDADNKSLGAFHVHGDDALSLKHSPWQEMRDRK